MGKASPIWTAITDDDRRFIGALKSVSMVPASFDKQWTRDLVERVGKGQTRISVRQRAMLCGLVYRYRRQIDDVQLVARSCIVLAEVNERLPLGDDSARLTVRGDGPPAKRENPLDQLFEKAAS